MSELDLLQLIESTTAQMVVLIGHMITINFAMMVAIYYFLNRAGLAMKVAAFVLYCLGSCMFLLFAVRESNVFLGAMNDLRELDRETLSGATRSLLAFSERPVAGGLTIVINASFWALWAGVFYLLFIWKRRPGP